MAVLKICRFHVPVSFLALSLFVRTIEAFGEVIYAVNCGGSAHVDVHGIHYQKDTLGVGYASDHGKNLAIRRVSPPDQILYQTERYHLSNFAYHVPIKSDGDYVLVLKFSEVWFTEANQKVFDVRLNGQHTVVSGLDIFAVAGLGIAHDEVVPFSVRKGVLKWRDETSQFSGALDVELVKSYRDNPKINAIFVMRGSVEDVPLLPPLLRPERHQDVNDDDDEEDDATPPERQAVRERRRRPHVEPKAIDPYASDDPSSMILPIIIAIAAFIPLVFCLCKL